MLILDHAVQLSHSLTTAVIALHGDYLKLVDTISTLSYRACGFTASQELQISATGSSIQATVTEEVRPAEPACQGERPPAANRRTVSVTYHWQPASGLYLKASDALDRLAEDR